MDYETDTPHESIDRKLMREGIENFKRREQTRELAEAEQELLECYEMLMDKLRATDRVTGFNHSELLLLAGNTLRRYRAAKL